ncbi:MAG: carboxymuconolactone decarboxylase family protein [Opitutae bacterium]|nr:carboxymuconolactone decarboxylase family protein [Opitutae bacterium]
MPTRLSSYDSAPHVLQAMLALQGVVNASKLEHSLLELVKMRASQINHCAFCLNMHAQDALKQGEKFHRLYLLDAWEEAPIYTARERAAIRWTEALTRLPSDHVGDETFAEVRREFTEVELLELTLAIITINGWNRLNVGFRVPPQLAVTTEARP